MDSLGFMKSSILLIFSVAWSNCIAQEVDFSGEWRPLFHEDAPERGPGPHFGDFSGLPLNDEARMGRELSAGPNICGD